MWLAPIKYCGAPLMVVSLFLILVFIKMRAIPTIQSGFVFGIMGRHPIKNDSQPFLMTPVHEPHEFMRCPIPGSRRKIPCYLIPPRRIIRIFHHRHKLQMGISHFLYVRNQHLRKLTIRCHFLSKATEMYLIYTKRSGLQRRFFSIFHESSIIPDKTFYIEVLRCGFRPFFTMKSVGVCFI